MPDQFPFFPWLSRSTMSPYWQPNSPWTTFIPPRPSSDPWSQLSAQSGESHPTRDDSFEESGVSWSQPERSFDANPGALAAPDRSNATSNQSSLANAYSAIPTHVGGGILAPFDRPTDWKDPGFPRLTSALPTVMRPGYPSSVSPSGQFSGTEALSGFPSAGATPEPYLNRAYSSYDAPSAPARQMQSNAIRLAGATRALPGFPPPIPPEAIPGTPEWTEQFIRGTRGLIDLFRRFGGGGGGGRGRRRGSNDDDDDDECLKRKNEETDRCYQRFDEYAHRDFLAACKDRAIDRWRLCIGNKGQPHPKEPPEWGPRDEEIWRNYGR
jgi:hypothetical protein